MAAWICGSAKIRANTNANNPPIAPASTPRSTNCFSMFGCPSTQAGSVAGETEEVPRVVDELVDDHAVAEHRRGALVDADAVVQGQRDDHRAAEPDQCLRDR